MKNMDREIKFRYRYTDGNNWIMRAFTLEQILNGYPFEVLSDNPLLRQYKMVGRDEWSGLHDKHGKPIYENDIVKHGNNVDAVVFGNIGYDGERNGLTGFGFRKNYDKEFDFLELQYYDNPNELEVIGDIHQHGDLLKSENKC